MKQTLNFWVLGGDLRQEKLAGLLREDGHRVRAYALEAAGGGGETGLDGISDAHCVVLPLPVCITEGLLNAPAGAGSYPLEEVLDALRPGQFICGGMVSPQVEALAAERGLVIHDYFKREELAVANAVPGALAV